MQYRRLLALFTTRGHHCMLFILSTWTPNFFSFKLLSRQFVPACTGEWGYSYLHFPYKLCEIHVCSFFQTVRFPLNAVQPSGLPATLVLYCLQTCLRCCPGHEWRCWMCWSGYFCKEALHSTVSFGDQVLWITEIWELGIPRRKETY